MLDLVVTNNNYVICDILKTNSLEYNIHASDRDSFTLNLLNPLNNSSHDIKNNNNIDNNYIHFNYVKDNMALILTGKIFSQEVFTVAMPY